MRVVAGILIGGRSRRMGRPKALIECDGRTLLERTVALADSLAERVVLLGAPPFDLPESTRRLPVLPDARPDLGPIGGLETLLNESANDPALLLACDMPRLTTALLGRLIDCVHCDLDAVAFATAPPPRGWHPCCAIYMPSAARAVYARVAAAEYSMQSLLSSIRTQTIELHGHDPALLANLNTPADAAGDRR